MNDTEHVFVAEHTVKPTENENGLVFVTLGSARFVLRARDANALGPRLLNAARTATHCRRESIEKGLGVE
jgi:hypothetical protein